MRDGAAAVENGMAGPQNRTIALLWGTDPKERKAGFRQIFVRPRSRQHHPKGQEAGASHVSIDRGTDKRNVVFSRRGILFSLEKGRKP